jgi:hypothetical protein
MTPAAFTVRTTSRYDRLSNKLQESHRDFDAAEKRAAAILSEDPHPGVASITSRNSKALHAAKASTGSRSAASVFVMTL